MAQSISATQHTAASGPGPGDSQEPGVRKGPFDHPVYKKLAVLNGEINKMTKQQMVEKLAELHLDTRGQKDVLKKRLQNYFKRKHLTNAKVCSDASTQCAYHFLLVIDFEATCDRDKANFPHEIIEFPVVLVDTVTKTIVDEFHSYVRPTVNPHLTPFCIELTGITQEQIDKSPHFPEVLLEMEKWMEGHNLGTSRKKYAILTDGPWDMSRFMHTQCLTSAISFPRWARKWINIRKAFCNRYRTKKASVLTMLDSFGLAFEGQQHSGIADARNIARIAIQMLEDGCMLNVNERIRVNQLNQTNGQLPAAYGQLPAAEVVSVPRDEAASSDDDSDKNSSSSNAMSKATESHLVDGKGDVEVSDVSKPVSGGSCLKVPNSSEKSALEEDDCADLLRYVAIQKS